MAQEGSAPRAFISHASEDKALYAVPLATGLRALGVDAWLDKWEIKPGDSLVARIFEEGLKDAAGVVIVLSLISVTKPWVEKELNVGVVQGIEKTSRVIPVRVDDCVVPACLKDLLWIDWAKTGDADDVAKSIADVLFNQCERPPLGPRPAYLEAINLTIPGLSPQDTVVLQCAFQAALDDRAEMVQGAQIIPLAAQHGISSEALMESAEVLLRHGLLWDHGGNLHRGMLLVEFPRTLFLSMAENAGHDIEAFRRRIAAFILNEGVDNLKELTARSGAPISIVEAILTEFANHGFLHFVKYLGGDAAVSVKGALFRRWLADAT